MSTWFCLWVANRVSNVVVCDLISSAVELVSDDERFLQESMCACACGSRTSYLLILLGLKVWIYRLEFRSDLWVYLARPRTYSLWSGTIEYLVGSRNRVNYRSYSFWVSPKSGSSVFQKLAKSGCSPKILLSAPARPGVFRRGLQFRCWGFFSVGLKLGFLV